MSAIWASTNSCSTRRGRARQTLRNRIAWLWRNAQALEGDDRTNLEARFHMTRAVAGGQDAVDRILNWKRPPGDDAPSEDAANDDGGPDDADVVD